MYSNNDPSGDRFLQHIKRLLPLWSRDAVVTVHHFFSFSPAEYHDFFCISRHKKGRGRV